MPRVETLPERRFAVAHHAGPPETVEKTRRPLYQHLILHELVGGPPVLRFRDDATVDVLVGTVGGFRGDGVATVEVVPGGRYAVEEYAGPLDGLPAARQDLLDWCRSKGITPAGPLLQVHLMDEIDGETEQRIEIPLA